MVELGLLTHPAYRFCFVLDKTSMFRVESNKPDGSLFKHQVKAQNDSAVCGLTRSCVHMSASLFLIPPFLTHTYIHK
jgi:hypothetical protein